MFFHFSFQFTVTSGIVLGTHLCQGSLKRVFVVFVDGFNPSAPVPNFYPTWTFNSEILPECVSELIHVMITIGLVSEIPFTEVKCLGKKFLPFPKKSNARKIDSQSQILNPFFNNIIFQTSHHGNGRVS